MKKWVCSFVAKGGHDRSIDHIIYLFLLGTLGLESTCRQRSDGRARPSKGPSAVPGETGERLGSETLKGETSGAADTTAAAHGASHPRGRCESSAELSIFCLRRRSASAAEAMPKTRCRATAWSPQWDPVGPL